MATEPSLEAGSAYATTGGASTTRTFTIPSGTAVGDIIAIICAAGFPSITWSSGSGATAFSAATPASGTGGSIQVLTHAYTGSEGWTPGTTTVTATASASHPWCGWIGSVTSTSGPDPAIAAGQVNASSTTITVPGVTTMQAPDFLIWAGFQSASTPSAQIDVPAGFAKLGSEEISTGVSTTNVGLLVGTGTAATAGATGNQDGSLAAIARVNGGVLISFAPLSSTPVSGSDTATGTDLASVGVADSDAGAGTDTASVTAAVPGADPGAGTDTAQVSVSGADTGGGTDTASVAELVSVADTGAGTDSATVLAEIPAADSGTGTDLATVGVAAADTGAGTDSATVSVTASDTGAGTDTAGTSATLTAADTGTGTDSAVAGTCGPVAPQLEGNLLSQADSDFETWTGNWQPGPNTTVDQSADTQSYTGCFSIALTAAAAGTVSAVSPFLPASEGDPAIASGYMSAALAGRTGNVVITWYDDTFTELAAAPGSALPLATARPWTPLTAPLVTPGEASACAPAGAAWLTVTLTASGLAAGETAFGDLVYAARSCCQVLISWNALPLADPPLFADVTPWVRISEPLTLVRGRQDNISEVQAGTAVLTVDNTSGWFTAGGSGNTSPWAPGVKIARRMQVNLPDETGAFWTRFDGQLTELPVTWNGPGAFAADTVIAASDVLARLNREPDLETWSEEEVLSAGPLVFYDLSDASGSTTASDSSGSLAPPLQVKTYGVAPPTPAFFDFLGIEIPISFGPVPAAVPAGTAVPATGIPLTETTTDPVTGELSGPLSTWLFTPSASAVAQLEGALPAPVTAAEGFAFGCWANCTQPLAQQTLIMLGSRSSGLVIGIQVTAAGLLELVTSGNFLASSPTLETISAGTVPGPITLTTAGTGDYIPGPGTTALRVQATAPGGPGQGTDGVSGDTGTGGSGGEYAEEPELPVEPLVAIPFSIGAAPSGPGDAPDTTFGSPVKVHAHGGEAGNISSGTPSGSPGGTGSSNTIHNDGGASASVPGSGGGGSGGPGSPGIASTDTSGAAAVDGGGPGGDEDASPETGPGGGGGGSESADFGQPGFDGQLAITPLGVATPGFMVAVSVANGVATFYVDNCPAGTLTLPAGASYDWLTVGGPMNGAQGASGWNGSISLAAVYPAPLEPGQFAAQWAAGTTGYAGATTGQMIANLARYASLPSFWYTPPAGPADPSSGLTTVSYMDLTGTETLAQMQLYEQVEAGVLYVNAAGQLAFSDRAARYAAGGSAQPAFVLQAGQYEQDATPKSNDQYLQNAASLSTADIPAGVLALNQGSIDDYGPYAPQGATTRTLQPTVGPWPDNAAVAGTYSADDLQDSAQWTVGTLGEPGNRIPAVTIDVLTLPPDEFSLAAFYGQVDVGAAVELEDLPSQAPAGLTAQYLIAEGFTETVQVSQEGAVHTIALSTSPAAQSNAWVLGDALLGVLGETTVAGRSATPAVLGPPYAPVAVFSPSMNRTGGVGAQDLRTLTDAVSRRLQPAFALAQQASAGTGGLVTWDTVLADTAGGFGGFGSSDQAYVVSQEWPGDYLCLAVVQFAHGQSLTGVGAWFTVTLAGGGPASWYPAYVAYKSTNASYTAVAISGIVGPCLPGDTISVTADPGSANLGVADGGSMLAVIWQGRGTGVPPALAARTRPVGPKHPRFRKGRIYR